MRNYLITLLTVLGFSSQAQVHTVRTNGAITPVDFHGAFRYSLKIPVVADTATAFSHGGVDSLGLVIQVRSTGHWWKRDTVLTGGHKWTDFGAGSSGMDSTLGATVYGVDTAKQALRNAIAAGGSGTDSSDAIDWGLKKRIVAKVRYYRVDSALLTSKLQLQATIDSLAGIIDSGRVNRINALATKQNNLASGNGTTLNSNKIDMGGAVSADVVLSGTNARTIQAKTNVRIGDSTSRIGLLFSDNFARSSLGANYTAVGSQTVTFPSSLYMQIAGGLDYTNNVYRNTYNGYNRHVDSVRFTQVTVSGSSYGLVINFYDPDGFATGFRCQFGTASGGLANIYLRDYAGVQLMVGGASLTVSSGDSLLAIVRRVDNVITATYKNLTVGGSDSTTLVFIYPTNSIGSQPATGHHAVGCLGGTVNISYWSVNSNEPKRVTAFQGDSRYCGGYLASVMSKSIPYQLFLGFRDLFSKLGGAGDKTSDANNTFPQLDSLSPANVLYALGINDATNSVALATFSANVVAYVTHCIGKGINVILMDLPPNNSFATKIYSDTLRAIAARYNLTIVNGVYDALRTGTSYNTLYSADGTHENDAAYTIELALIKAQAPQLFSSYDLITLNLPAAIGGERLGLIDSAGKHHFGLPEAAYQRIDSPLSVSYNGVHQTLTGGGSAYKVGLMINDSIPGGYPNAIIQNTATSSLSGIAYYGADGAIGALAAWGNSTSNFVNRFTINTYKTNAYIAFSAGNRNVTTDPEDLRVLPSGLVIPHGTTSNRPVGGGLDTATLRWNKTILANNFAFEYYYNGTWYPWPTGSGTPFSVLQKYSLNLGSTYDARTFVDKNYADSMAAAKVAAALSTAGTEKVVFFSTSAGVVTNSTTETTLSSSGVGSLTIPSGTIAGAKIYRIKASGVYNTNSPAGTLTISLYIGGNNFSGVISNLPASASNLHWEYTGYVIIRSVSSNTATAVTDGTFSYSTANFSTANHLALDAVGSSFTFATNSTAAIDLTAQWGTASTANTITCNTFVLESLN